MTTSKFLFHYSLPKVLFVLLLTNLNVSAIDSMSDRQVLEQMRKTAERLFDFKFIKCKYVIKTGLAKSLDDAVKFGPQDEFDSAEVLWLYDENNELIVPKVKYMSDELSRECVGVLVCSDKMYMASDKYLLVVDNLLSDGVVSLRDDPQYLAKYYHKITLLAEVDISRFIKDEYLTNERLLGLTERYGCDRIDIDVRLENDNLTVMRSAVFGNNKTPMETMALNYKTIFPCAFINGTVDNPKPYSTFITDYYTTKDNRVFPKRIVCTYPCKNGRDKENEWKHKDNEPVFVQEFVVTHLETEIPPSEDEFVIELPEPTGIGDGIEYANGATSIFAGLHPDFGLKITLADLPRLLNANRAEAAKRDHVPDVTYNKTLDIVVRVLLFAVGILLLIIGIYGSRRSRRNMN